MIAKQLLKIFPQVGVPKEILMDHGTNFMSAVLQALWQLLKVHPLRTSVYHPQTNSVVEKFNQMLKGILRRFVGENPRQWAQLLDPLLFGTWDIPHASTRFSPFELVFGRGPRVYWTTSGKSGSNHRANRSPASSMWQSYGKGWPSWPIGPSCT